MRVLSIDCTSKSVSAAIAENGILIGETFLNIKLTHSETLMPLISELLNNARLSLKDIDAFAVTAGPGSFTGVRIGISAVKGMAFANNIPVYSFSTLFAMSLAFKELRGFSGIICGLMDARCEQFYNAVFEISDGKINRICNDRIIVKTDLENELKNKYNNKNIILIGDGAKLFSSMSPNMGNIAPEHLIIQRAAGMAIYASKKNCELSPVTANELRPVYLRKSQAEREKKLNKM